MLENWDISDENDRKTLLLANGMMMMLITNPIHPSTQQQHIPSPRRQVKPRLIKEQKKTPSHFNPHQNRPPLLLAVPISRATSDEIASFVKGRKIAPLASYMHYKTTIAELWGTAADCKNPHPDRHVHLLHTKNGGD
jgi:hypothetical protein